jgi:hypothetical protein
MLEKGAMLTVWKVTGELSTDSGTDGDEEWLYVTANDVDIPDCRADVPYYGGNGRTWHHIEKIERVGWIAGLAVHPESEDGEAILKRASDTLNPRYS